MSARTDEIRKALAKAEANATALRAELDREEKAHGLGVGGDTVVGQRWAIGLCCAHPKGLAGLGSRYVAVLLEDYSMDMDRRVLAMEDLQAMQVGLDAAEAKQMGVDELRQLAGLERLGSDWPVADDDAIPF